MGGVGRIRGAGVDEHVELAQRVRQAERAGVRSVAAARAAGAEAVAKLAHAERLRAEAVEGLIKFDAIDATPLKGSPPRNAT